MSQSFKRLGVILCAFVALAMSSLACDEVDQMTDGFNNHHPTPMAKEWVAPSQRNLTVEQKNELLKMVEFSVDGSLPEGTEAGLFLGEARIWELWADGSVDLPLEADERSGITLEIRNAGSTDEWAILKTLGHVEHGATIRISFDGGVAKIGIGTSGG
jgi:hypothetical protein